MFFARTHNKKPQWANNKKYNTQSTVFYASKPIAVSIHAFFLQSHIYPLR